MCSKKNGKIVESIYYSSRCTQSAIITACMKIIHCVWRVWGVGVVLWCISYTLNIRMDSTRISESCVKRHIIAFTAITFSEFSCFFFSRLKWARNEQNLLLKSITVPWNTYKRSAHDCSMRMQHIRFTLFTTSFCLNSSLFLPFDIICSRMHEWIKWIW